MPRSIVDMVDVSSLNLEKPRAKDVFQELLGEYAGSRRLQKSLRGQLELDFVQKNCDLPSSERFKPLSITQSRAAGKTVIEGETLQVNSKTGKVRVVSPAPRKRRSTDGTKRKRKSRAQSSVSSTDSGSSSDASSGSESESSDSDDAESISPRSSRVSSSKGGSKSRRASKSRGSKSNGRESSRRSPRRR